MAGAFFEPSPPNLANLFLFCRSAIGISITFGNIWLFKSNTELIIEDSISVDNNITKPTKQIVIKGVLSDKKIVKKWSLEKI